MSSNDYFPQLAADIIANLPDGATPGDARRALQNVHVIDHTAALAATGGNVDTRLDVVQEAPLNVLDNSYGGPAAAGDGTGNDGAVINAKLAALPASGGEVLLPMRHSYRTTETITLNTGQRLIGSGGGLHNDLPDLAASKIISAVNGPTIQVPNQTARWGIDGIAVEGDLALTSQDLLVINTTSYNFGGIVNNVGLFNAGRDNLSLNNALYTSFVDVHSTHAGRHNLHAVGNTNGNNALHFRACKFRQAQQWGIWWERGSGTTFEGCVIESNSMDGSTTYGGIIVPGTNATHVNLIGTYFENNAGAAGTGPPLQIEQVSAGVMVVELGSKYEESNNNPVIVNGGKLISIGITTVITPHAIIGASGFADFYGPHDNTAAFSITDNSNTAVVVGGNGAQRGVRIGDVQIYRANPDILRLLDRLDIQRTNSSDFAITAQAGADTSARYVMNAAGQASYGPGNATQDLVHGRLSANQAFYANDDSLAMGSGTGTGGSYIQFWEQSTDPGIAPGNAVRLFAKDNGSGKTQICVKFPTGATQVLATEA